VPGSDASALALCQIVGIMTSASGREPLLIFFGRSFEKALCRERETQSKQREIRKDPAIGLSRAVR
jgi:hypothetical protein